MRQETFRVILLAFLCAWLAFLNTAALADNHKKTGHRISGKYPDKGFQQKIAEPKATPTPSVPYYPY